MAPFQPGISDDEYTEVAGGGLAVGDEVVIDVTGGPQRAAPAAGAAGGANRRPPRLF